MTQETEILRQWIAEARNIVFFGGAGVSTASGIPDFRSAHQGIYNTPGGRSLSRRCSPMNTLSLTPTNSGISTAG